MNVVMINLAYDVPVKLYASHLLFSCLFLLALDSQAAARLPRAEHAARRRRTAYDPNFARPWQRWAASAVKVFIVYQFSYRPAAERLDAISGRRNRAVDPGPFAAGVYDVRRYVVNRDTIPAVERGHAPLEGRDLRQRGAGSVNTTRPDVLAALSARLFPLQARHDRRTRWPCGRRRRFRATARSSSRCGTSCPTRTRFAFTRRFAATRFTSSSCACRGTFS